MAEIRIEPRPRPRRLPWLIGLVVLAGVLYFAVRSMRPKSPAPEDPAAVSAVLPAPA